MSRSSRISRRWSSTLNKLHITFLWLEITVWLYLVHCTLRSRFFVRPRFSVFLSSWKKDPYGLGITALVNFCTTTKAVRCWWGGFVCISICRVEAGIARWSPDETVGHGLIHDWLIRCTFPALGFAECYDDEKWWNGKEAPGMVNNWPGRTVHYAHFCT